MLFVISPTLWLPTLFQVGPLQVSTFFITYPRYVLCHIRLPAFEHLKKIIIFVFW